MTVSAIPAPSPAAILRACGWLTGGAGLVGLRNLSSTHSVHLATRSDGVEAIVKQRKPDGKRGLAPELFVYRLAGWTPRLGTVLARPLHVDEGAQVLALEALPAAHRNMLPARRAGFARLVGRTLAAVHGATLDIAMPFSPALGILEMPDNTEFACRDRPGQTRTLMHRIANDAALAGALRAGKAAWHPRCLIHGDIRPDHWVEMPDGTLRLIDWEMAGGGDPALDFAAAMVEAALDRVRSGSTEAAWLADARESVSELAQGYQEEKGPIDFTDADARTQIIHLGVARLLHVACEWTDAGGFERSIETVLGQAHALLDEADAASAMLSA